MEKMKQIFHQLFSSSSVGCNVSSFRLRESDLYAIWNEHGGYVRR